VLLTLVVCAVTVMFVCNMSSVKVLLFLSEFVGEYAVRVHATSFCCFMGSYLRDAMHEGSADVVACLHVPRA
jgi:hypothetical protein